MRWVGALVLASYQADRARLFTVLCGWKVRGNGLVLKQELHMGVRTNFTMKTVRQGCPQGLYSLGGLQDLLLTSVFQ